MAPHQQAHASETPLPHASAHTCTIGTYVGGERQRGQKTAGERKRENYSCLKACHCYKRVTKKLSAPPVIKYKPHGRVKSLWTLWSQQDFSCSQTRPYTVPASQPKERQGSPLQVPQLTRDFLHNPILKSFQTHQELNLAIQGSVTVP